LTHFTDSLARTLVASARQADQVAIAASAASAENTPIATKGKGNTKTPVTTSTTKRKPRARKVKKEQSDEDKLDFEDVGNQDESDFEDSMIMNKRAVQTSGRKRRSGVEASQRR